MHIVWDHRTKHITRAVTEVRTRVMLRRQELKTVVRLRRKKPSGNHSSEYVLAFLRARFDDTYVNKKSLTWMALRERLLERNQNKKAAAKLRRRPSVNKTSIFLWKRRKDWLQKMELCLQ